MRFSNAMAASRTWARFARRVVAVAAIAFAPVLTAENVLLVVYSDHFEVDARRLDTVAEVREALRGRDVAILVRGCDVEAKVLELKSLLDELAKEGKLSPVAQAETSTQCRK